MKSRTVIASAIACVLAAGVCISLVIAPDKTTAQQLIEAGQSAATAAQSDPSPTAHAEAAQSGEKTQSKAAGQVQAEPSPSVSASPKPTVPAVSGENVSVIGDSVTLASATSLQNLMPGIDISAEVSRSYFVGMSMTQEWAQSGRLRPYVVIALATNGAMPMDAAEQIVQNCGPDRRVVFVTGFGPAHITWIPQSNQTIHDIAAKYPDRVAVADWAAAIQPHQDLLAADDIHPGAEGGAIFAQTVQDALASFGGEIPAQTSSSGDETQAPAQSGS